MRVRSGTVTVTQQRLHPPSVPQTTALMLRMMIVPPLRTALQAASPSGVDLESVTQT